MTTETTNQFELLYQVSQKLNSSLDFEHVLNAIMAQVIDLLEAERGFIILTQGDELECQVSHGIPRENVKGGIDYSRSVVDRVLQEESPVRVIDALSDNRFAIKTSVRIMGVRSVLCVPLKIKDRMIGIIYLDRTRVTSPFRANHLETLVAFANTAAIAIENARLYKDLQDTADERVALERKVAEQERLTAVLETGQKMREEIAHYLIHDMRNPLSILMSNLSFLRSKGEQFFTPDELDALTESEQSAERLMEMIHSILEIYRLEEGQVKLDFQPMNVGEVTAELVRANRRIVASQVSIISEIPPDPIFIHADKGMIRRTISNLISNAAHFTAKGSITIRAVETEKGAIVSVQDTGPGIPPEYTDKIFEKFESARPQSTEFRGFFGLGLRFCRLAVDAHKGDIWVESEPGKGSTFHVLLPRGENVSAT